jgi:hypothetical protein
MFSFYSDVVLWLCVIYHLQMHYTKWISSVLGAFLKLQITTINFVMSIYCTVQETVIKHNQSHNSNIMTTCFGRLSSHLQVNNNEFKTKHPEVYKMYSTIKTIETYLNKLMGSHVKYV